MARTITLNKTYAEMQALIAANGLNSQTFYKITDRGDRGLLFQADTVNSLSSDGKRYMLCPATYATGLDAYENDWIGVWNATKGATATVGQLTIWNGLVWVAGATLSGDSPDTEASGWTVIPKASFINHEYIEMIFGVTYDFEEDWINKQWDSMGNKFGVSKIIYDSIYELSYYLLDYCDFNLQTSGNIFSNNKCGFIYNNSNDGNIRDNICTYDISGNSNIGAIAFNCVSEIKNNSNNGGIGSNKCNGSIINNSHNGTIELNINNGNIGNNSSIGEGIVNIQYNTNNGSISGVWDADVTDTIVDKIGTAE